MSAIPKDHASDRDPKDPAAQDQREETVAFDEGDMEYRPVPPKRSYTVQVRYIKGGRVLPMPYDLDE